MYGGHQERDRQTDRQTETETETDRQTDRQTETESERQRQTDRDRVRLIGGKAGVGIAVAVEWQAPATKIAQRW